jgi:hypothetical protein
LVFIFHLRGRVALNGLDTPGENTGHDTDVSQAVQRCKPKATQVTYPHFGMVGFGILHG